MKITKENVITAFKTKRFNPDNYEFTQVVGTIFGSTKDKEKLFDEVLSGYPELDAIYCEEWKGLLTFRILRKTTEKMYDLCKSLYMNNKFDYYRYCIRLYIDGKLSEANKTFNIMEYDNKRECLNYMAEKQKDAYIYFFDILLKSMN